MAKKHYLDVVIVTEELSTGEPVYVAHCTTLGITSQGSTIEEAQKNIREAIDLYLKECPEKLDDVYSTKPPTFSFVEVSHDGQVASIVR